MKESVKVCKKIMEIERERESQRKRGGEVQVEHSRATSGLDRPQKALRGVIPISPCLVLGAILGEIVVKS